MSRIDGRTPNSSAPSPSNAAESKHAEGSVLISFGDTKVFCTASVTEGVPRWRKGSGEAWVTARVPCGTTFRQRKQLRHR
ncbi:Ribonuclease PH [Streptomyces microflavus]